MSRGAFVVHQHSEDPRDIHFQTRPDGPDSIPSEQVALKTDVEQALTVLRTLFQDGDARFGDYFRQLLALAQLGLAADPAQPGVAAAALLTLKNEITAREGGWVKNRYMKALGVRALAIGIPTLLMSLAVLRYLPEHVIAANFLALWSGCMAGVWLSFGARKTTLKFEDLHIPEQDRLEPVVRLLFAGLLTVVIGLSFSTGVVVVMLGSVSTAQVNQTFRVALLIGMLCGFGEQILSLKVARQASSLLEVGK